MRISTTVIGLAGFLAGAVASHLATAYAQGPPGSGVNTFECRNFVLMDSAGHKRGEWKVDASGQPVLRLFDKSGRVIWDTTGTGRPQLVHEP